MVQVSVGYWHRDGIESKQRLDGMLASSAKKFVLDLLSILVKVMRRLLPAPRPASKLFLTDQIFRARPALHPR